MNFPFSIVTGKTAHRVIHADLPGCIDIVRSAYLTHGAEDSVNPRSYFITFPKQPGCRIIALPAYLGGKVDVAGIKWIASYPQNIQKGFPRASAVLVLNDFETGYPFACIESSVISAARTAGSAVLAAQTLLGRKQVESLAIIGTGLIARYMYEFLVRTGWEIGELVLNDLSEAEAERFRQTVVKEERHRKIRIVSTTSEALRASELSVLATVAGSPHLADPADLAHNPVVLHVSLRDFTPEVILGACNIVDDVDHVLNANTSVHLAEQKTGNRDFIHATLAQVLQGKAVDRSRPIIFSPFGLGVLDLAVGKWVYDAAIASGEAVDIPEFFFDLTR